MKFYVLLSVLTLASVFSPVHASDVNSTEDENYGYCTELAQNDGIEDESEKSQFVNECLESFKTSSSETDVEKSNQQMN